MEVFAPILIVAIIVLGLLGAIYAWKQEQKRREELRALAHELGWSFDPHADRSHDEEYAHFELFRRGHSRSASNTLTGTLELLGVRCMGKMGDFTYKITTSNGKTTTTHTYRFSYLIIHLPMPGVPDLLIRPEGLWDKLTGALGFDDIDFESEEFSRAFHVSSPDRKFAYDVIHPRMMEFLMQTRPACVDLERCRLCLSDGKRRWQPSEFRGQLDWSEAFFGHWPEYLVRDLPLRSMHGALS